MNELRQEIHNGESFPLDKISVLNINEFRNKIIKEVKQENARICSLFGQRTLEGTVRLFAIIAKPEISNLEIISSYVNGSYESITPGCPQVHLFEREIAENFGIVPEGHPCLKQVRSMNNSAENFFKISGDQVHEVAVGPVHAGIIEPGHFRFQCAGETVLHLEITLGYQHRGIEAAITGGPDKRTIRLIETIAGDTTIGHTVSYCQLYESLSGMKVPARADYIRAIALELERLANHTGDLGALANDIGFLPTASYCGRIRGDFLNMTALICGSRFGRTLMKPGGVNFDFNVILVKEFRKKLNDAYFQVKQAAELLWESTSVMNRFTDTGKITSEICKELGIVGVAARACGIERDARNEFPTGIFNYLQIPVSTWLSGDVFSRAYVRWMEIERSVKFINELLEDLPSGPIKNEMEILQPGRISVTLSEGWRGEICHTAITGENGKFICYKVTDPSFHNWPGLSMAMRNQQISDFPLCNKSFNLSYCGFDL
jgi:Ni,Fe-hydrogenase III large subunit